MEIWPVQQDEWLAGYLGRLAAINNCASQLQVTHRLDDFARSCSFKGNYLEFLAQRLGMNIERLLYGHTFFRLHKAFPLASSSSLQAPVVTQNQFPYVSKWFNAEASFCPKCVERDKDENHFAHWRRSHQLPGVWHCSDHKLPLKRVSIRDPMNFTPCKCATATFFNEAVVAEVLNNQWIESTHQILLKILDSERTIDQQSAFNLLREITSLVDSKGTFRKNAIAEIVADVTANLPAEWLRDFFPSVRNDANNYVNVLGPMFKASPNHRNGSPTTKIALLTARCFPAEVATEMICLDLKRSNSIVTLTRGGFTGTEGALRQVIFFEPCLSP